MLVASEPTWQGLISFCPRHILGRVGPRPRPNFGVRCPVSARILASELHGFAKTAAAVCQTDIVAAAGTIIVHLAGMHRNPVS
jgi:hypothetical protein